MHTISMTNIICGSEGSTYYDTRDHKKVVDFRYIHLAFILGRSMYDLNTREAS